MCTPEVNQPSKTYCKTYSHSQHVDRTIVIIGAGPRVADAMPTFLAVLRLSSSCRKVPVHLDTLFRSASVTSVGTLLVYAHARLWL